MNTGFPDDQDPKKALTTYWLEKAYESLESAKSEYASGRLSFAVNRVYYACFYALSALLRFREKTLSLLPGHCRKSAIFRRYVAMSLRETGPVNYLWISTIRTSLSFVSQPILCQENRTGDWIGPRRRPLKSLAWRMPMDSALQNQYEPDVLSPPGDTLIETLEALGMSQAQLAERTGRSKKMINEIIKGKAPITPKMSIELERVLGVPAGFWNNRERHFREYLARRDERA
jgi:addiction module HigA family antidote